ncbi:TRAP transporter small permease [Acuticoccus kandeliae]|uniref:TRAP transporter small permease n=1 Tax=Acuticoccus kandeliae TaxID=2073160 RepID=UPI000D3EAC0C|nr:TRAP transporter small permease subunit [Acuticoccus kandeliae]
MTETLRTCDRVLGFVLRAVPVLCLSALFVILFANIISRYFQLWSLAWFDEIVETLFAYLVFIGAAALWREGEHFRVDWVESALHGRARALLRLLVSLLSLAFLIIMTIKGYDLAVRSRAVTPILGYPTAYVYAAIPISGAIMLIYSLFDVAREVRGVLHPAPTS